MYWPFLFFSTTPPAANLQRPTFLGLFASPLSSCRASHPSGFGLRRKDVSKRRASCDPLGVRTGGPARMGLPYCVGAGPPVRTELKNIPSEFPNSLFPLSVLHCANQKIFGSMTRPSDFTNLVVWFQPLSGFTARDTFYFLLKTRSFGPGFLYKNVADSLCATSPDSLCIPNTCQC